MLNIKNPGPVDVQLHLRYILQTPFTRTMLRLALFILHVIGLTVHHMLRNELFIIRSKSMCLIIHNIFYNAPEYIMQKPV